MRSLSLLILLLAYVTTQSDPAFALSEAEMCGTPTDKDCEGHYTDPVEALASAAQDAKKKADPFAGLIFQGYGLKSSGNFVALQLNGYSAIIDKKQYAFGFYVQDFTDDDIVVCKDGHRKRIPIAKSKVRSSALRSIDYGQVKCQSETMSPSHPSKPYTVDLTDLSVELTAVNGQMNVYSGHSQFFGSDTASRQNLRDLYSLEEKLRKNADDKYKATGQQPASDPDLEPTLMTIHEMTQPFTTGEHTPAKLRMYPSTQEWASLIHEVSKKTCEEPDTSKNLPIFKPPANSKFDVTVLAVSGGKNAELSFTFYENEKGSYLVNPWGKLVDFKPK